MKNLVFPSTLETMTLIIKLHICRLLQTYSTLNKNIEKSHNFIPQLNIPKLRRRVIICFHNFLFHLVTVLRTPHLMQAMINLHTIVLAMMLMNSAKNNLKKKQILCSWKMSLPTTWRSTLIWTRNKISEGYVTEINLNFKKTCN